MAPKHLFGELAGLSDEERLELLRAERFARHLDREKAKNAADGKDFSAYFNDPVGFCTDVLRCNLWWKQCEVLEAVPRHEITLVKSGQKTGKSLMAMACAWWWLATRKNGYVIATSGNQNQVKTILWKEFHSLNDRSGDAQKMTDLLGLRRDALHNDPATGIEVTKKRAVYGFTAKDKERMAGQSGAELLFIVDESSGFDDKIWEAIRGNLMGGGRALCLANPTRTTGWFFDIHKKKQSNIISIRIDSRQTPNYVEGRQVIPGLAMRENVDALIAQYGIDSPIVAARILGEFPKMSSDAVLGLDMVSRAQERWDESAGERAKDVLEVGVDVARFGDDESVVAMRRGAHLFPLKTFHGLDGYQLATEVLLMVRQHRRLNEVPVVRVDGTGVGASCVDALVRSSEVVCESIEVGSLPSETTRFKILRDEVWWSVREWIESGGTLPPDDDLFNELLAPTYGTAFARGATVICVQSKDDIRKTLKRSPDRADAVGLAVYPHSGMSSYLAMASMGMQEDR